MNNERVEGALWFVLGFSVGSLVGAILSLLLAPQPGKKTRKQIHRASVDARERTIEAAHKAKDTVEDFVDQGIGQISETLKK